MPNISVMIKPASSLCNLNCSYCFYNSLSKQREICSFGIISHKTIDNIVEKTIKLANGGDIYYAFQGGEPLLAGLDCFQYFVKSFNKQNSQNSKVQFSLQTNGTLINDEYCKFFKENNFLIGLSLDGDQTINRFRKTKDDAYAFPQIINGLNLLRKWNVEFNILSVITGYSAKHMDLLLSFFKKEDLHYLQFIPCLKPFNSIEESDLYMNNDDYFRYLDEGFSFYADHLLKNDYYSIRYFDNLVELYLNKKPELCGVEGHCTHQFVIESNGNIYPCDFYCLDKWLLGNVNDNISLLDLAKSQTATNFIKESITAIPDTCKKCTLFPICRAGGCKRQRESYNYCEAYKKFFIKHSLTFSTIKNFLTNK